MKFPLLRNLLGFLLALAVVTAGRAQQDTIRTGRFTRGTGTNPTLQSFVAPLDFQRGLECGNTGGIAEFWLPYLVTAPLYYHYNATNPASLTDLSKRIAFRNPLAAFGSRGGGSPLYIGQQYRFGAYGGVIAPYYSDSLVLYTWTKTPTNLAYVGATPLPLPDSAQSSDWLGFQTNGFAKTVTANGLTTIVSFENALERWGVTGRGTFVLTHLADASATNKVYQLAFAGSVSNYPVAATGTGTYAWQPLYTLEFETRAPWRAVFVDQPHFNGEPLPPAYHGKTVEELLTNVVVSTTFSLAQGATTYTNLDHSPELRRHPVLDQFVSDQRRDPVALARYVHNEIELTDAISYSDNGSISEIALTPGGVARGALATFLEGQGSPAEQCALLVYLLRQAGMPAVYVYPAHNGLTLLDTQLSRLLRMQLQGALNEKGAAYTTNRAIPVNYPWVAAYVGTNWIHLFPWLKDTELVEGLNLSDYLPAGQANGYQWLRDFALGKTNLLGFSTGDDTPLAIYPRFLQNALDTAAPGISPDDLGFTWRVRKHGYARWQDFPKPWAAPVSATALDTLSSANITNVYAGLTNIFDTLNVEVSSVANPAKKVTSGDVRLVDLHNRRLVVRHEKTGSNLHNLILSLAAFRTNATGSTNFTAGDALLNSQQVSTALNSTDNDLNVRVTYRKHRSLPPSVATNRPSHFVPYLGLTADVLVIDDRKLKKGDLAAVCLDYGRVSQPMLRVNAQELWNMERTLQATPAATNTIPPDLYQGGTAYLMGMAYYERNNRFRTLNERLHKARVLSEFAYGVSFLSAKRVAGSLPNQGDIILVQPGVDMNFRESVIASNHTLHPDSDQDANSAAVSYRALQLAELSAEEHHVIDRFYRQSDSISTVKLLQMTQQRATNGNPSALVLNAQNYVTQGNVTYNGVQLKNHDAVVWSRLTDFFNRASVSNLNIAVVTPGAVTNLSNTYKGMGALLFSPYFETAAIIGGNLNGGVGKTLPDTSFTPPNLLNYTLTRDEDGNYSVSLAEVSAANRTLAPELYTDYDQSAVVNNANAGYYYTTDTQDLRTQQALAYGTIQNVGGETFAQRYARITGLEYNGGDVGNQSVANKVLNSVYDPVNAVTGEFYHDEVDLTLPGPFPLELRRNYSSHNLAHNQFGHGWRMNYVPFLTRNVDDTVLYAAEMDGTVLAYEKQSGTNLWLVTVAKNPLLDNRSTEGMGSTANRFRNRITRTSSGGSDIYTLAAADGSTRSYKTVPYAGFSATKPYLLTWTDHRGNSLSFEYGTDSTQPDFAEVRRIQASNGNYLGFAYDVYGHITEAYAGDGRRVKYDYDEHGDLTAVTRPDASEVGFEYEHKNEAVTNGVVVTQVPFSTHLLIRETKPDGRLLVNQYDAERRVAVQLATVGPDLKPLTNAVFAYTNNFKLTNAPITGITGSTTIRDINNNPTVYRYDSGLITNVVDAANIAVSQVWWQPSESAQAGYYTRSLKRLVDRRGLITDCRYDTNGNVTTNILTGDLTGAGSPSETATTTTTYNANSLPLVVTDPVGNRTQFIYDGTFPFLPQQVLRLAGTNVIATNHFAYYSVTNTFTLGGQSYTNAARGLLQREIRAYASPDASTNEWVHDGRGFATQRKRFTGNASDPSVIVSLVHNDRGELIEEVDAASRTNRYTYDGLGRRQSQEVIDETGERVAWDFTYYNGNGEVTWSDGPRYDPEDYVWRDYDGAGRPTQEIRWRSQAKVDATGIEAVPGDALYAVTFQEFDGYGNLKRTVNPRGVITTNLWDVIGRLTQRKVLEADGTQLTTEGFAYEAGNQVRYHTNALGGITETQYTSTGKPKYRKDASGAVAQWRYDLSGRTTQEILNNGSYWLTSFDDASRKTTRIFKNAANAAQATNTVELDRRGNAIRSVDAGGNAFTNWFDGLDRLKAAAGPRITFDPPPGAPGLPGGSPPPVQQAGTNYFDAAGIWTTNVNALGEKTITQRDVLGRTLRVEIRSAANQVVRETSTAYYANHMGALVTEGSSTNAVETYTFADETGRVVLSLGFASGTRMEYTGRVYDAAGNLVVEVPVTNDSGVNTVWEERLFAYDGLNRLLSKSEQDNAVTTFAYDALSNLTNRVNPGGLVWRATYNNAGQMLANWNIGGGGAGARTNTFAYYAAGHAFAGLPSSIRDGRNVTNTLTYDDWLRPATNVLTGTLGEHNLTTITRYDARGLVTNLVENFANATNGPATALGRSHDPYGRLLRELVTVGTNTHSGTQFSWDSAGRRAALGFGTFGFNYSWRADGLLASATGPTGGGSYAYNNAGLLTSRTLGTLVTTVTSRDQRGRVLAQNTKINGANWLSETLDYTGDGRLNTHGVLRADYYDARSYTYAGLTRRLTEERTKLDDTTTWTNVFQYDNGTAAGSGVLTKHAQSGTGGVSWTGGKDAFGRLALETNNVARRLAVGRVNANNGYATVAVNLDGQPQVMTTVGSGSSTWPTQWRTVLDLKPGAHTLQAVAYHPSGQFSTNTSLTFTNNAADKTANLYDAHGQLSQRNWTNSAGQLVRRQLFTWDGRGRLLRLSEREGTSLNNGFDWSAAYDALGRRLQTTAIMVTNGTVLSGQPKVIASYFDPLVEFLELGVTENGRTTWKLCGPDLNGAYGGMNGTGGFDAIVPGPELFCPVFSDARGNLHGVYDQTHGFIEWFSSRPTGYGAVPGRRPVPLGHGAEVQQASAWRGRWSDLSGLYWLGARYYDPVEGRFLSADPLGHDGDPGLYAFAFGDPVNYFDPDGRFGKGVGIGARDTAVGFWDVFYNVGGSAMYALSGDEAYAEQWDGLKGVGHGLAQLGGDVWNGNLGNVGRALTGGEDRSGAFRTGYAGFQLATFYLSGAKVGQFGRVGEVGEAGLNAARAAETASVNAGRAVEFANWGGEFLDDAIRAAPSTARERVLANLEASATARAGSRFDQFERLNTALDFYEQSGVATSRALQEIKTGIDLSHPVSVEMLQPGHQLAQFQPYRGRMGSYFADVATPGDTLGINPAGRMAHFYEVNQPVQALRSTAASTTFNTSVPQSLRGPGGGTQYFSRQRSAFSPILNP